MSETLLVLFAMKEAANAKTIDFVNIAGSNANSGIPNNNEFMTGESTAVNRPTFNPYLYEANNVKK